MLPPVAGFEPLSLSDWPGHVVAVIFTRGCNMRCPWCHNPCLVWPEYYVDPLAPEEVLAFLARLDPALYDGVVVSGGEPLVHAELPALLSEIKARGLAVRLDTNGSVPDGLAKLVDSGLVDAVAVDYKLPLDDYGLVHWYCPQVVADTLRLVAERNLGYARTTVVPGVHTHEVLARMEEEFAALTGGKIEHRLQAYRPPAWPGKQDGETGKEWCL